MTENRPLPRKKERSWGKFSFSQAFKQAPWRSQAQLIGLFLVALVVILLVSGVYLTITGQAAADGLTTLSLNNQRRNIERTIADSKAQLALLTSASVMEERALAMGYEPADPADVIYVVVPGYAGRKTAILAPPPGIVEPQGPVIKSIYRQSLWDWMFQGFNRLSNSVEGK
jgi:hypothetical protein